MKNLIIALVAILALGLSSSLMAQRPNRGGSPEEMAKKQTEQMKTNLGLNDDQTVKVGELNLKFAKKREDLRAQASDDRQAMRESMNTLNGERNVELKNILTKEQYQKHLKTEQERKQQRGQGQGQGKKSRESF